MAQKVRWGILAPGGIARKFAEGLQSAAGAELIAVGSRSKDRADAFADEFDIPRRHGSYADLVQDDEVDAIYVATPHPAHKDCSILCLKAGKAVLCEKPLAVNASEAEEMIQVARAEGVFLMEAMWTRFLPSIVKLREIIASGEIGEVRMVMADFGFRSGWNPDSRLLDPALAGGGLLDVGIYPLSLASMILGSPCEVKALAHLGETGVDEQAGMVLSYEAGRLAMLACGVRTRTPHEAVVIGTEGRIHLHELWWRGSGMSLRVEDKLIREIDEPIEGNGYNYEAEEVGRCLEAGQTESETMPLDESLQLARTMDEIRKQWGLKYPFE
jgi:dihydrodiol dehydrogenase / D-xylose 1-dehydrogenase (NADP)